MERIYAKALLVIAEILRDEDSLWLKPYRHSPQELRERILYRLTYGK